MGQITTKRDGRAHLALWMFLVTEITMFGVLMFIYVFLHFQKPNEHLDLPLPRILWLNTAIILASSITCEAAVRAAARDNGATLKAMLAWTMAMGVAFLTGQLWAWNEMALQGLYTYTNVLSGMFYMLTGFHGAHLLAAIVILAVLCRGAWGEAYTSASHQPLRLGTIYWHFLGILWLALFLVLLAG